MVAGAQRAITLFDVVEKHEREAPSTIACVDAIKAANGPAITVTYGELASQARRLSEALAKHLGGKQELLASHLPRGADFYCLFLAAARLRVPFVGMSTDLPDKKAEKQRNAEILEGLRPSLLVISGAAGVGREEEEAAAAAGVKTIALAALLAEAAMCEDKGLMSGPRPIQSDSLFDPTTLCYNFTGGTTKASRCATISHEMALHEVVTYPTIVDLGRGDRILQQHSVYWAASAFGEVDIALAFGCALVFCEAWSAEAIEDMVTRERVSCAGLVPSLLAALDPQRQTNLRCVFTWGEALKPPVAREWAQKVELIDLLISTECWLSLYARWQPNSKVRPPFQTVDGVKTRLLSDSVAEDGAGLRAGEGRGAKVQCGELLVAGRPVTPGYSGASVEAFNSEAFFQEGDVRWYRTKDRLERVAGGLVYKGRADTLIKVGGAWVDIGDVQRSLEEESCVAEACMFEKCAVVSFKHMVPGDIANLRSKLPAGFELFEVPKLPRNVATEKVDRKALMGVLDLHARPVAQEQANETSCLTEFESSRAFNWPLTCLVFTTCIEALGAAMWSSSHSSSSSSSSFSMSLWWILLWSVAISIPLLIWRSACCAYASMVPWCWPEAGKKVLHHVPMGPHIFIVLLASTAALLPGLWGRCVDLCLVCVAAPGAYKAWQRGRMLSAPVVWAVGFPVWAKRSSTWWASTGFWGVCKWYAGILKRQPWLLKVGLTRHCSWNKHVLCWRWNGQHNCAKGEDGLWYCQGCWDWWQVHFWCDKCWRYQDKRPMDDAKAKLCEKCVIAKRSDSEVKKPDVPKARVVEEDGRAAQKDPPCEQQLENEMSEKQQQQSEQKQQQQQPIDEKIKPSETEKEKVPEEDRKDQAAKGTGKENAKDEEKQTEQHDERNMQQGGAASGSQPELKRHGESLQQGALKEHEEEKKEHVTDQAAVKAAEKKPPQQTAAYNGYNSAKSWENRPSGSEKRSMEFEEECFAAGCACRAEPTKERGSSERQGCREWEFIENATGLSFESLDSALADLDSLRIAKLTSAVRRSLGRQLTLHAVRCSRTLGDLLKEVQKAKPVQAATDAGLLASGSSRSRTERTEIPTYNCMWHSKCAWFLRCDRPVSEDVIRLALANLIERHVGLRAELVDPQPVYRSTHGAFSFFELSRTFGGHSQIFDALAVWAFKRAWPTVRGRPLPVCLEDVPLEICDCSASPEEARNAAEGKLTEFVPPFQASLAPFRTAGSDETEAKEGIVLYLSMTHMYSDGFCIVPLTSDLSHFIALAEGASDLPPLMPLPNMFEVYEQRLLRTIDGHTDAHDYITPEAINDLGKRERRKTIIMDLTSSAIACARGAAKLLGMPEDTVMLAAVGIALEAADRRLCRESGDWGHRCSHGGGRYSAGSGGCPLLVIAPQRDGPGESELVGLFADLRCFVVKTAGLSVGGVALRLHHVIKERLWRAPGACMQSSMPLVNFEWTDLEAKKGLQQFVRPREWRDMCHGPAKIVIANEVYGSWRMRATFDMDIYEPKDMDTFFTVLKSSMRALCMAPLTPVSELETH